MRSLVICWFALVLLLGGLFIVGDATAQGTSGPGVMPPPGLPSLDLISPPAIPNLSTPAAAAAANPVAAAVSAPVVSAPVGVPMWYDLAYWFGPEPWDIGFELGLNGNSGINDSLSMRTGMYLKREIEFWKFDTSLVYNRNSANGVETQNNALLDVRVDRMLGDSPWSLFFLNQDLYDEFQAYDLRVTLNSGMGYELIDTETLDLVGRFGAGASREFGGPEDLWAYEALFGLDYDHKLSATQRLSAKVDYFPEWEDFGRYRVVADLGWEIDLDRPRNVSLKFSVLDRYDSTPNGVKPNEINYAVLLIWGL